MCHRSEDKAPQTTVEKKYAKTTAKGVQELPASSRFLKGDFLPSKKDACTKLGRQRSDRKVRQKLDIAWYGGLEGEPVARSTVQNEAL